MGLPNAKQQAQIFDACLSSIIGLVKYMKMYGLASDEAAALVIARRRMRLSERIPDSINAHVEVNSTKHEWSQWNQLNKQIKRFGKGKSQTRRLYRF